MSALVDRALEAAGIGDVLPARRAGALSLHHEVRLRAADLLAVGALADRVRQEEVGAEVRIYTGGLDTLGDNRVCVLPVAGRDVTGLELLREIALLRVTGPHAARLRVDWMCCGLELAQVALGFGANELVGRIASKRGLPIASGDLAGVGKRSDRIPARLAKRRELAAAIRRAGREPVFIGRDERVEDALLSEAT